MKIGIIGATGRAGTKIMEESLSRGHEAVAIVRNKHKVTDQTWSVMEKDLFQLTTTDLLQFDVVVHAFGAWGSQIPLHEQAIQHLTSILSHTDVRLIVVGGAGSLFLDKEHTLQLKDRPDYPPHLLPIAEAGCAVLIHLQQSQDLLWTYLSPAEQFDFNGERTNHFIVAGAELIVNQHGMSSISGADYAIALVNEIEDGKKIKQHFSVVGNR